MWADDRTVAQLPTQDNANTEEEIVGFIRAVSAIRERGHGLLGIQYSLWIDVTRGGAVVSGTTLQAGRSRVRFAMMSLEFFIDIILPAALWS